jgi:hypothetical protein
MLEKDRDQMKRIIADNENISVRDVTSSMLAEEIRANRVDEIFDLKEVDKDNPIYKFYESTL